MLFSDKASAVAHAQRTFATGVPDSVRARIAGGAALDVATFVAENLKVIQPLRSAREEAAALKLAGTTWPKALADCISKQEGELLKSLVSMVSQGMRYTVWAGIAELREELRQVAGAVQQVLLNEFSSGGQDATLNKVLGKVVGALFGGSLIEGRAPSLEEANELITLIASMLAHADSPLQSLTFPEDRVAANETFFKALVTEFFTHSAKHSHSSASFWASFEVQPMGTGQLNGQELGASLLGASTGGGKLRDATWLLPLLTINLAKSDQPAIWLFDCLRSQSAREKLMADGLAAVALLPYCGNSQGKSFNGHLVPIIRFPVPGEEEGPSLAVVPSNGMLKAMVELRSLVRAQRETRREPRLLEQAAQVKKLLHVDDPLVDTLVLAYHNASPKSKDKAREALSKHLKKHKPAKLTKDAWAAQVQEVLDGTLVYVSRGAPIANVGIVGSQPQNVSNVYNECAGNMGVPRFPAYRKAPVADSPLVRRFFALQAILRQRLSREASKAPVSKLGNYQVGTKWLPNRVQMKMQAAQAEGAASRFLKVLGGVARAFKNLTDEEQRTCAAGARSALERYVLFQDVSPDVLDELSREALIFASSASKAEREAIIESVKQRLKGA